MIYDHFSETVASWFRANQSLLFLLNAECSAEIQQIPLKYIFFGLTRSGLEPAIYHTEMSTLLCVSPMCLSYVFILYA